MSSKLRVTVDTEKSGNPIPKGAKILTTDEDITVKEIENGFLICKRTETKYQVGDNTDWNYQTKEYYSKENPLEITFKDEDLATAFDA